MSDICDAAEIASALFLTEALTRRKPVEVPTQCEFCEENAVEILPNGARSRFCAECGPIALAAAA